MKADLEALQRSLADVSQKLAAVDRELAEFQPVKAAPNGMRPGALDFKACPSLAFGRRVFRTSVPASPMPDGWTDDQEPPCA